MDHLEHFQNREDAIEAFDRLWDHPTPWILAYTGFSGHGKSTMLDWLVANRCTPQNLSYALVGLGENATDPEQALNLILETGTFPSSIPSSTLKEYRTNRRNCLEDLTRRQVSLSQSQSMQTSAGGQQTMSADLSNALRETKRQSDLLIAESWLDCLTEIHPSQRVVFLLDNYDVFQDSASLDDLYFFWNILQRAINRLSGLRVIVASREPLRHQNDLLALQNGLSGENLKELSEVDSDALLRALAISDSDFRQAVYTNLARGHPLITRMAGEAWLDNPDRIPANQVPNLIKLEEAVEWVHGRIIERLQGPLKQAVRWAAVLRWFHAESLNAILQIDLSPGEFQSLIQFSFIIRPRIAPDFWACHDILRRVQIDYLRHARPEEFINFHLRAKNWYEENNNQLNAIYHHFCYESEEAIKVWSVLESEASFKFNHPLWSSLVEIGLSPELILSDELLAQILFRAAIRHYYRSEWVEFEKVAIKALELFRAVGDRLGEANTLQAVGDVQQFQNEYDAALDNYGQALEIYRSVGSRLGEANTLQAVGDVQQFQNEYDAALDNYSQALELFRSVGSRLGEANTLKAVGDVQRFRQEMEAALDNYGQALEIFRSVGSRLGEANTLKAVGDVQRFRQEMEAALDNYGQALEIYRSVGDRLGEASQLMNLGIVYSNRDDHLLAIEYYSQALAIDPDHAMTHRNRAESLIKFGRLDEAVIDCQESERLAPDHPFTHARWGQLLYAKGQYLQAIERYQHASSLYPDDSTEFNFDLALPLLCLGRVDDSLEAIRARLNIHPHPSDLEDMIPYFEELEERSPNLPGLSDALNLLRSAP